MTLQKEKKPEWTLIALDVPNYHKMQTPHWYQIQSSQQKNQTLK